MGLTVWLFQRHNDGSFRWLSRARYEGFLDGHGMLDHARDGFVYFAEVVVELEQRKPRNAREIYWVKDKILPSGRIDKKHYDESMLAAMSMTFPMEKPPEGVIASEHRFAGKKYAHMAKWEPSAVEFEAFAVALRNKMSPKQGR